MRLKSADNNLMWESYANTIGNYPEDESEVVMSFEPMGALDHEEHDDFDDIIEDEPEDYEHEEHEMSELVMSEIKKLAKYSDKLLKHCSSCDIEPWMMAKLVKAATYVADVWDQIDDTVDFANDGMEDDEESMMY
jgi:hypothetical protein